MAIIEKEVYDIFDNLFIEVKILTDAYEFFGDVFSETVGECNTEENNRLCNILYIFNQYAEHIRSQINEIDDKILIER